MVSQSYAIVLRLVYILWLHFVLDFLQGERYTQRKRFDAYKLAPAVYFSLAMEPVKLEYGSGLLNQQQCEEKHTAYIF